MGRKKKNNKNGEDDDSEGAGFKLNLSGEVKRSVAAIFLFALAVVSILGFLDKAGILGGYIDKTVGLLFGFGKWLSPVVMVIAGIILLFRKETLFYVSKLIGLMVAFASALGFLHIYLDGDNLLKIAQEGKGGGYVGYAISAGLLKFTGTIAGTVILLAIFLIGVVVAFDFSIVNIFRKIPDRKKEKEANNGDEPEEETESEEGDEKKGEKEEKEKPKEEGGIRNIKFVEGPEEVLKKDEEIKGYLPEKRAADFLKKEKKSDEFISRPLDHSWKFPPLELLESSTETAKGGDVEKNAQIIKDTLGHFGIVVERDDIKTGPTVTQYSFKPAVGVKVSRITALNNDLALALAAHPIRIEAPIPNKALIGVEVPNKKTVAVRMKDILQSEEFRKQESSLSLALGEDVSGSYHFGNLEKMPHLMIAGSTGSGKSICINSILISLFYQNSPDDLKLILVDPKRVELSLYNHIPYLLTDVIVENGKVVSALRWAIGEMEKRYRMLQDTGARDLASYNQKVKEGKKRTFSDPETGEKKSEDLKKLPYIVIIIDELADLMQAHGKEVEGAIIRLAQMSRAIGIHLIISTQRPSVEVLTGLIKANIPTRIAFMVATQIDSRTILDASGAEKLLGDGDMLYVSANSSKPKRLQGVFVSEAEVKKVVRFIKNQKAEKIEEELGEEIGEEIVSPFPSKAKNTDERIDLDLVAENDQEDSLYEEAKKIAIEMKKASSSLLMRRLRIGYSRSARLIDMLEKRGVVGPADGAKPREILITGSPDNAPEYEKLEEDQEKRDKWQM